MLSPPVLRVDDEPVVVEPPLLAVVPLARDDVDEDAERPCDCDEPCACDEPDSLERPERSPAAH